MAPSLTQRRDVIVIGASAGGPKALTQLLAQLPPHFPAAVLIVNHLSAVSPVSFILERLRQVSRLPCRIPFQGEKPEPGHIYLAPPDRHLLLRDGKMLLSHGPKENRFRPSVDSLFRSAAAHYGSRVIGVVLTGLLDDGTAGLSAIRRSGGLAVVQSLSDAEFPDMPSNALRYAGSDYTAPLREMPSLLAELIAQTAPERSIPEDITREASIAERTLSGIEHVEPLGTKAPYSCPECGGSLWEMTEDPVYRFRCQVGHAISATTLFREQGERLEETLWVALRMLEERRHMLDQLAERERRHGLVQIAQGHEEAAADTQRHIGRIREILLQPSQPPAFFDNQEPPVPPEPSAS